MSSALRFYGDQFVFDTESGMFFRLSPTAGVVLQALNTGMSLSEAADLLQRQYGIDKMSATRDVELLLNDLTALHSLSRAKP